MPAATEQNGRCRRDARTCLALLLFTTCGTGLGTGVLVQGTSGDDHRDLSAETRSCEVFGNGGWDTIRSSTAADIIYSSAGLDRLIGTGGNDILGITSKVSVEGFDGESRQDSLQLNSGGRTPNLSGVIVVSPERTSGGPGLDTIIGSCRSRRFAGGPENDTIDGADGNDTATLVIMPGHGTATVNVQMSPTSGSPTVKNNLATTGVDRSVTVNVLLNDFDADGDEILVPAVAPPMHGEAVRQSGPSILYTPMGAYLGAEDFSYAISDSTGRAAHATVRSTVEPVGMSDPLMTQLAAAPEGSWVRLNRNRFSDVWVPAEQRPKTPGYMNPAKVVFAWGSMAWDPNRAQLVFWGGGHANYSGNEVYRFDARSGLWARASLPSDVSNPLGDSQFFAVDGPRRAPTSSHTYDNQEFLPLSDRFVTFGGAKFNGKHRFVLDDGITATGPYFWDPNRAGPDSVGGIQGSQVSPERFTDVDGGQMWANRDTVRNQGVAAVRPSGDFVNSTSAYEEFEGRDSILITESPRAGGRLFRYIVHDVNDASRDEWILVGGKGISYGNQGAGAVDSGRRLYARTARISSGWGLVVWNTATLGSRNYPYVVHPTDQRGQPLISELHGMDFDPVRNVFVVWDGGPNVWHLKPGSSPGPAGWTAVPAVSRPDLPTPLQSDASLRGHTGTLTPQRGVLGKWKYSRRYDVMLGMVSPEAGDVWAFKPTGWRPHGE